MKQATGATAVGGARSRAGAPPGAARARAGGAEAPAERRAPSRRREPEPEARRAEAPRAASRSPSPSPSRSRRPSRRRRRRPLRRAPRSPTSPIPGPAGPNLPPSIHGTAAADGPPPTREEKPHLAPDTSEQGYAVTVKPVVAKALGTYLPKLLQGISDTLGKKS